MTCPAWSDEAHALWLMAYGDGELDAAREAEVRAHLDGCAACREELASQGAADAQLRAAVPALRPEAEARERWRVTLEGAMGATASPAPLSAGDEREPARRPARSPEPRGQARWRAPSRTLRLFTAGAIAALVLVSATLGLALLPDPVAADLARQHVKCLGRPSELIVDPLAVTELLRRELDGLDGPERALDLGPAGYRLKGAVGCELGGRRYVHLVYVAPATAAEPAREPVSVFVAPARAWSPRGALRKAAAVDGGFAEPLVVAFARASGFEFSLVSLPSDHADLRATFDAAVAARARR